MSFTSFSLRTRTMSPAVRSFVVCWIVALAGTVILSACLGVKGTQTTDEGYRIPSNDQARIALNEGLGAFNDACIVPDALDRGETFPTTVVEPDTLAPPLRFQQLQVLQAEGLLTNQRDTTSGGLVRLTFSLTEEGEEVETLVSGFRGQQTGLCFAKPRVTRIASVSPVPDRNPRPLAEVVFTHSLQDVQPWARNPEIQRLFPSVRSLLQDVNAETRTRRTVVETEDGWKDSRLVGRRSTRRGS